MAFAILLGGLVLLVAVIMVAVRRAATHARREWNDLDGAFAEARGYAPDQDPTPPWSSFDLAGLRDDVTDFDQKDPFVTLEQDSGPMRWQDAEPSYEFEEDSGPMRWQDPEPSYELEEDSGPNLWPDSGPSDSELEPMTEQAAAWRAPTDAPVIILVVGVGFLGAGGAAVNAAAALRVDSVDLDDFSARARRFRRDFEAGHAPRSSFDAGAVDGVIVDVEGHDAEPPINWERSPNGGNGSEPERIAWRAPSRISSGSRQ
jgi:hypothetical protein